MNSHTKLDGDALLSRIKEHAGLDTLEEAAVALSATLAALGEVMPAPERRALAESLPERFGSALVSRASGGAFDVAALFERVARDEVVSRGFAREHAQVACRALGDALSDDDRTWLERALPSGFGPLFRHPPHGASTPLPSSVPRELRPDSRHLSDARALHSLATGRPGSAHPISEARPPAAQSHSVVLEGNPHGDTKLSSGG